MAELWSEAQQGGLAVDHTGAPMRGAATEIARAFLSDAVSPEAKGAASSAARASSGAESPGAESPGAASSGSTSAKRGRWERVQSWLTPAAMGKDVDEPVGTDDFNESIPPFWREQLSRVNRSEAQRLVRLLGGDNVLGWLKHKARGDTVKGLLEKVFEWKAELPECVMLVQVGDFFETWGCDAVMCVQWCGLNPMARKPRAGFPATGASLQQAPSMMCY